MRQEGGRVRRVGGEGHAPGHEVLEVVCVQVTFLFGVEG